MRRTFAALTFGDFVLFTFKAYDTFTAREIVGSLRKGSETIIRVRLLHKDDMGPSGTAEIPQRG
jgi:hypothetical protein